MLVDFLWRCLIKVDFATAASQHVVCIFLKKYAILYNDLVSQLLCDKDVSNNKCNVFCHFLNNTSFFTSSKNH
jgi:hypothetical protein